MAVMTGSASFSRMPSMHAWSDRRNWRPPRSGPHFSPGSRPESGRICGPLPAAGRPMPFSRPQCRPPVGRNWSPERGLRCDRCSLLDETTARRRTHSAPRSTLYGQVSARQKVVRTRTRPSCEDAAPGPAIGNPAAPVPAIAERTHSRRTGESAAVGPFLGTRSSE